MTNGEKLLKIFPNMEINKKMHKGIQIDFDSDWWNAEYKEPTTKNDLGVDCISRADVNQVIDDYMDEQYHVLSDRTRERAFGAKVVMARINELPSVTSQEPRWIPVSEKLPNDRDWYLGIFKEPDTGWINPIPFICDYVGRETKATTKEYWILRGCTDRDERTDYYFNLECVAWMPLPSSSSIDALIMREVRKNDKRKSCL